MSAQTGIEWCDSTFNSWMGCTKVSPACDHCYAERDTKRFGRVEWGAGKPRVRTSAANWKLPERWNDKPFYACSCGARGESVFPCSASGYCDGIVAPARRRVFCASLADWLDNEVPIEWLVDLLDLIRRTPNLDWLQLTKRIGNWHGRLLAAMKWIEDHQRPINKDLHDWILEWFAGNPPANVWVGATVINQAEADRDVPKLLAVPARIRFLSIEPMLGPVTIFDLDGPVDVPHDSSSPLHWVIAGGESGPRARPSHPDWYRSLRDQCAAAGVPFLFKQWGEWLFEDQVKNGQHPGLRFFDTEGMPVDERPPFGPSTGNLWHWWEPDHFASIRIGKSKAGRLLDGRTHDGFPAVQP